MQICQWYRVSVCDAGALLAGRALSHPLYLARSKARAVSHIVRIDISATASAAKPFAAGAPPAAGGGQVLEVRVPAAAHGREVEVVVTAEKN